MPDYCFAAIANFRWARAIRGAWGIFRSGGNSRAKLARSSEASVPAARCVGFTAIQTFSQFFNFFRKYFLKFLQSDQKRLYSSESSSHQRGPPARARFRDPNFLALFCNVLIYRINMINQNVIKKLIMTKLNICHN